MIDGGSMLYWINSIFAPNVTRPCALIMDGYPAHWTDEPAPRPAESPDTEELGPTRYGDWVRKGIAVDF